VLAGERPLGFAVSNEVKLQELTLGGDHLFALHFTPGWARRFKLSSTLGFDPVGSEGLGLAGTEFDTTSSCCRYAAKIVSLGMLVVILMSSPSRHCIRQGAQPIAAGSMIQGFLCRQNVALLASPNLQAGCWMARANETTTAKAIAT